MATVFARLRNCIKVLVPVRQVRQPTAPKSLTAGITMESQATKIIQNIHRCRVHADLRHLSESGVVDDWMDLYHNEPGFVQHHNDIAQAYAIRLNILDAEFYESEY